jgi:phosphoglycerol transferase MdoB-like AlkP superfamily enzyme
MKGSRTALPVFYSVLIAMVGCALAASAAVFGVAGGAAHVVVSLVAILAMALASLPSASDRIAGLFGRVGDSFLTDTLLLLLAAVLLSCGMELSYTGTIMVSLTAMGLVKEAIFLFACFFFLHSAAGMRPVASWAPVLLSSLLAVANHYVYALKGAVLSFSDFYAIGTAAEVASGYSYAVDWKLSALAVLASSALLVLGISGRKRGMPVRSNAVLAVGSAVLAVSLFFVFRDGLLPYQKSLFQFRQTDFYMMNGLLPSFARSTAGTGMEEPEGYSETETEKALERLAGAATADAAGDRPNIVVIMNESYCDLSSLSDKLGIGYERTLLDEREPSSFGNLYVSTFGGGTCNSELEFLTGWSCAFRSPSSYIYSQFHLDGIDSLPAQLKGLGYRTVAIHPQNGDNWMRAERYPELGFDEFIDIDGFAADGWDEEKDGFHRGISDGTTYKEALDELEGSADPVFVFDVTMANHSPYDYGNLKGREARYSEDGRLDAKNSEVLREYISCIEESDRDLLSFLGDLDALGEDTIVLMFGDHQPYITQYVTQREEGMEDLGGDRSQIYDAMMDGADDEGIERDTRLYRTDWAIWRIGSETDGEDAERIDLGANMLAAKLLAEAGLPLTDFQRAQLSSIANEADAVCFLGWKDTEGAWHPFEEAVPDGYISWLPNIEWMLFGSKVQ